MSFVIRDKPQPSDLLSDSQPILKSNNNNMDDSIGRDHYAPSNTGSNNGKHRTVTTPTLTAHPTTALDCKFYAMQDAVAIGGLQYTRAPNEAVPSPLTPLQSGISGITMGAGTTTNVLDFNGIPNTIATLYYVGKKADNSAIIGGACDVFWDGSKKALINNQTPSNTTFAIFSGSILQIDSGSLSLINVAWTLVFHRIQTPI